MNVKKYLRKPFEVEAVQVTTENIVHVADWCSGQLKYRDGNKDPKHTYIKVKVYRPISLRQTQAFVGDWILKVGKGFKIYSEPAFSNSFEEIGEEK